MNRRWGRRGRDAEREAIARVLADSEQITADVEQVTAQLADITAALSALAALGGRPDD